MTRTERQTTFSLASIYVFRMLGLFMILPIFSLSAQNLQYANAGLIGFAMGIYGLSQAFLQIPFGMVSDRIGRKPVILFGLILFILGSVIAAEAQSIYGIIIGRAIQGAGAIGSTLIALLADNIAVENRLKAMSTIGMSIGFSFMIALILGPLIHHFFGLAGIFWLTALLAALGIIILFTLVPNPPKFYLHQDSEPVLNQFKKVLLMPELLRLNYGIFSLHAILMALFIALPLYLTAYTGLDENQQWQIYLPVLIAACITMLPLIIVAETKQMIKPIFIIAVLCLSLCALLFHFMPPSRITVALNLWIFFTAFTVLEGILPSLISKIAPIQSKGTAMGIYSSSQFLGIFFGGSLGGILLHRLGMNGIFVFCSAMGAVWLLFALTMQKPAYLSSKIVNLAATNLTRIPALQASLLAVKGVKEALISVEERAAYLKIDKKQFIESELSEVLAAAES